MRNNIIKRVLIVVAIFVCGVASSQTLTLVTNENCSSFGVSADAVGCWVLDCTMVKPECLAKGSITQSDDLYSHTHSGDTNRVFPRLLIDKADYSTTANWTTLTGTNIPDYSGYGYDDWRLPTQRELAVMRVMANDNSTFKTGFPTTNYFSATSDNDVNAWCIMFSGNVISVLSLAKSGTTPKARPVRELPKWYNFYKPGVDISDQLFAYLEVSAVDDPLSTPPSTMYQGAAMTTYPQSNASTTGCMPTKAELMAMYIFQPRDNSISQTKDNYWSATDYNEASAWYTHLGSGYTQTATKTTNIMCIRPVRHK